MTVGVPNEAITDGPHVQWNHIDGPLMTWAGGLHWLTGWERLGIWMGLTSVDAVAIKRFPRRAAIRAHLLNQEDSNAGR